MRRPLALHSLSMALVALLAGCVSTGGLEPHGHLTSAQSLHSARSLPSVSDAQWPTEDWWTGLHNASLTGLIEEALRTNPSLAEADARVAQAQAQAQGANAARQPQITAGANLLGQHLPATAAPPELGGGTFTWFKDARVNFSWGLDLWGGKRAAWEAAVGQQRAAAIDAQAARIELSVQVAQAYVQLGYAFDQQTVADAEHERAAIVHQLTQQRVAAGLDTQLQLKQSDTEVANAEQQQAAAQRSIDAARATLSVLLGQGPDRGLTIERPQPLSPEAVAVPAQASVELVGHRPDLVAARWQVEAASKDIQAAKSEFLPNISLGAMAGVAAAGGINPFQLPARLFTFGPSLSLPIFDGGRLRANLAGKDAQYDAAVAHYNTTLVRAINEVADDYHATQTSADEVAAQQRAVEAATQAWALAQQRYTAGVGSYLEALIVRQQLLAAQQRLAALHAQQVNASLALIQALGGGFRPQSGSAPERATTPALSSSASR